MKPYIEIKGKDHRVTVHREGKLNNLTVWKGDKRVKWYTCGPYPTKDAHWAMKEVEPDHV